jgi:hypothetical protein
MRYALSGRQRRRGRLRLGRRKGVSVRYRYPVRRPAKAANSDPGIQEDASCVARTYTNVLEVRGTPHTLKV